MRKLKQIAYHRNGVTGAPFYAILFEEDGNQMLATYFPDGECACAVINLDSIQEHGVTFGVNSYRGDHYVNDVRQWVEDYNKTFE